MATLTAQWRAATGYDARSRATTRIPAHASSSPPRTKPRLMSAVHCITLQSKLLLLRVRQIRLLWLKF
jgi:hypothetical protein